MSAAPARLDAFRLASIFIRFRLRSMRNAFRSRGRGRTTLFAAVVAVITAFAYVGLFTQAFSVVARTVDLGGQLATLALVTAAIAFGSLSARAASSEAVRAGSPENEFLLARPVSLAALVAGRGLADAVTDPVGGLFLLPVLISATVVWKLGAVAIPIAISISMLMQVGISMLAYTVQLAVVRFVPSVRRRMVWTGLRMVAALSLATLWMLGTYVMRAPATLATHLASIASMLSLSPTMLVSAPLAALKRGEPGYAAVAMGVLALGVGATVLLTIAVARRAGMAGWEEAGAAWADVAAAPRPTARLPTAATKDLRLIVRDRAQLLALIAMPVIFIGVQVFGAAGWSWTTAGLGRVSWLAYSLALYMSTIGPLAHMQAERRAFWILRTVPVPLSSLLAAKARAWAVIVGGIAALAFTVLSISVPNVTIGARVTAGLLVTAGAAGISFIAVAMASGGADLSDDTNTAVGPGTVYAYLFVGGLFNLVLVENFAAALVGLALYGFVAWTHWQAGVEQAAFCLDAEVVRQRRVRAADGATMLIGLALGNRALARAADSLGDEAGRVAGPMSLLLVAAIAIGAAIYLVRRPRAVPRQGPVASLLIAAGVGAVGAGAVLAAGGLGPIARPRVFRWAATVALAVFTEEMVLRGVIQRSLSMSMPRIRAAAISVALGLVTTWMVSVGAIPLVAVVVVPVVAAQTAGAAVYALTGRVAAAWLSRVVLVGVAAFA